MAQMTMAELLAKQEFKPINITRGSEVEGTVISIVDTEIVLDLGGKAEGVLSKKELPLDKQESIKVGDKLSAYVVHPENDSGQVLLGLNKASTAGKAGSRTAVNAARFQKFENALKNKQQIHGKALELNKGGLIIEVDGVRGFLPTSQMTLTQASQLEDSVGKDFTLVVIEVDPAQNRLIFSQKGEVSEDLKKNLSKLKVGDIVKGVVAAILPFGAFVTLSDGVEGLIHISEISWDKTEDAASLLKVGEEVSCKVVSVDSASGRVNLSIKQVTDDPFLEKTKDFQPDDVIKATVTKVGPMGVSLTLDGEIEGLIPTAKMDPDTEYEVGKSMNVLVDSVDARNRRINLAPFITSTKDLIYK